MTAEIKNPTETLQEITTREIGRLDSLSKAAGLSDKEVKTLETLVKIQKSLSSFNKDESAAPTINFGDMTDEELAALS